VQAEIGNAAGVVWRHLAEKGPTALTRLARETGLPDPLALMAVGWLAREEKLTFTREGRATKVALRAP